jgi:hypothetical protein
MLKTDGGRTGVLVGQIQNCVIQKEAVTGSRHSRMIGTDMVSGIPISLGFDTHVDRVKSIQTSASVGCDMSTGMPLAAQVQPSVWFLQILSSSRINFLNTAHGFNNNQ